MESSNNEGRPTRFGPSWYPEATFTSQLEAEQWLAINSDYLARDLNASGISGTITFRITDDGEDN